MTCKNTIINRIVKLFFKNIANGLQFKASVGPDLQTRIFLEERLYLLDDGHLLVSSVSAAAKS